MTVAAAGILLRKRAQANNARVGFDYSFDAEVPLELALPQAKPRTVMQVAGHVIPSANTNDVLLNLIKEEMFAIEREKLSGSLPLDEYTPIKAGLDALLRRALRAQKHVERQ